ncbi:RNA 2'-phosphotransferase [Aquimarina spongiae]|uniref:Probable RNA 2'-phosphotransferase n=1 Tax=Aquimarina spongiae TaxID=570521 RepID=A0A1M6JKD0_9FLAO|nr:RNA 2'-phosphotransferase [Aquimarina spongiae]SHJ47129.1 putative RNA 2'-phosphotransferase [Aquimarina spongiae]
MTNTPKLDIENLINYWLRHNPDDGGIVLDEYGWVKIEDLLLALAKRDIHLEKEDLIEMNANFDPVKWKIDLTQNTIKSSHGHSISILHEDATFVPSTLYHGTGAQYIDSIKKEGLKSMKRQYVHLTDDVDLATEVGSRHGVPVIIKIDTEQLLDKGWKFYKTEKDVWLTRDIPSDYLEFADS